MRRVVVSLLLPSSCCIPVGQNRSPRPTFLKQSVTAPTPQRGASQQRAKRCRAARARRLRHLSAYLYDGDSGRGSVKRGASPFGTGFATTDGGGLTSSTARARREKGEYGETATKERSALEGEGLPRPSLQSRSSLSAGSGSKYESTFSSVTSASVAGFHLGSPERWMSTAPTPSKKSESCMKRCDRRNSIFRAS